MLVHAQDGEPIVLNVHLLILDLVFDKDALQLVPLREAFKLLVDNSSHQRRLPTLVRTQESIKPIPLEVHLCVAQQSQSPVGQREGSLVEVHALRVLDPTLVRTQESIKPIP